MILKSETPYCQAVLCSYRLFEFLQYLIKTLKGCRLWFRLSTFLFFSTFFLSSSLSSLSCSLFPIFCLCLILSSFNATLHFHYPLTEEKRITPPSCAASVCHTFVLLVLFLFLSPLDASTCLFPLCSHCVCSDTHNLFFLCSTFFFFLVFHKKIVVCSSFLMKISTRCALTVPLIFFPVYLVQKCAVCVSSSLQFSLLLPVLFLS